MTAVIELKSKDIGLELQTSIAGRLAMLMKVKNYLIQRGLPNPSKLHKRLFNYRQ